MERSEGRLWIIVFRKRLIASYVAKIIVFSLAFALLSSQLAAFILWPVNLVFWSVLILSLFLFLLFNPIWKISYQQVINYLDQRYEELEESSGLLFKSKDQLNTLEKLQVQKINSRFPLANSLQPIYNSTIAAFGLLALAVIFIFLLDNTNFLNNKAQAFKIANSNNKTISPTEIKAIEILIAPPKYTKISQRSQADLQLKVEAESLVKWIFETDVIVKEFVLVFNNKDSVHLKLSKETPNKYSYQQIFRQSGFYQILINGKRSDLYQIEVIPDLPVLINVIKPKSNIIIDMGQLPSVSLEIKLTDDYGVSDSYITATLASGKGEGVSFTEKKITFNNAKIGGKNARLIKEIDLLGLGMKPGDELYLMIKAFDNKGNESQSNVFSVAIVDKEELMSMAGMTNGVDLVPEYFRSQRQIIIDTEKLLKDRSFLSELEFKNRSNDLGVDQKLLRLRYGKFLGEEFETEVGGEHDHDDDSAHEEVKFGDVKALMDQYAHKHDIAEDATFFEPELKSQLKLVLNEMWISELNLRTYKPQEALPYAYKALRLLKDLQQKSRAFVAKTTLKTIKLKNDKRLSGELDKILSPVKLINTDKNKDEDDELSLVLAILEQFKETRKFNYGDKEYLRMAEASLINKATQQPTNYLNALKSLRKISVNNNFAIQDIELVQKAIYQILGETKALPQKQIGTPAKLSKSYYNYLKKLK